MTEENKSDDIKKNKKPVLIVDMDDVLCHYVAGILDWHNEKYGTVLSVSDVTTFELHKVWGGSREETLDKIRAFSETDRYAQLPAIQGATASLRKLSHHYDLVLVTARGVETDKVTRAWLKQHMSKQDDRKDATSNAEMLFSDIHYTRDKKQVCERLAAEGIIDDGWHHIHQCSTVPSVRVAVLFNCKGLHPWSQIQQQNGETCSKKIKPLQTWDEVVAVFAS